MRFFLAIPFLVLAFLLAAVSGAAALAAYGSGQLAKAISGE